MYHPNPFVRFNLICQFIAKYFPVSLIYDAKRGRVSAIGNLDPIRKHDNDNEFIVPTWSA